MHVCVLRMYACLSDDVLVLAALGGRSDWRTPAHIHNGATPETAVLQHRLHEGDAVVRILPVGVQILGSNTLRDTERRTPCMCKMIWIQLSGSTRCVSLNTERRACATWNGYNSAEAMCRVSLNTIGRVCAMHSLNTQRRACAIWDVHCPALL